MRLKVAIVYIYVIVGLSALGLAQLNLGFAADMPSPSWRTKTGMPTARGQAAVVSGDDGLIYVMGGYNGTDIFSTVEAYNPLTDTWTVRVLMPQATGMHAWPIPLLSLIPSIFPACKIHFQRVMCVHVKVISGIPKV